MVCVLRVGGGMTPNQTNNTQPDPFPNYDQYSKIIKMRVCFSPMSNHEFVSQEDFEKASEGPIEDREYEDTNEYSEAAEKCKELSGIATQGNGVSRISVPRELKRQRVVNAFQDAFELIGGVPRLALWADTHPTDFFKLYARLLPVEASQKGASASQEKPTIIHVVPPGPLDKDVE